MSFFSRLPMDLLRLFAERYPVKAWLCSRVFAEFSWVSTPPEYALAEEFATEYNITEYTKLVSWIQPCANLHRLIPWGEFWRYPNVFWSLQPNHVPDKTREGSILLSAIPALKTGSRCANYTILNFPKEVWLEKKKPSIRKFLQRYRDLIWLMEFWRVRYNNEYYNLNMVRIDLLHEVVRRDDSRAMGYMLRTKVYEYSAAAYSNIAKKCERRRAVRCLELPEMKKGLSQLNE